MVDRVNRFGINGKGNKSRCTILPTKRVLALKQQIDFAEAQHPIDMRDNVGEVYLPHALNRKHPRAATQLAWQYVFPAKAKLKTHAVINVVVIT
ncbi:MAG: hypothetical protein ACJA0N_002019 [Pseudohongiellaceae bacterium]